MIIVGRNPVMEAIKSKRDIEVIYLRHGDSEGSIRKLIAMARENKILIKEVDKKKLEELAQGESHQGVAAQLSEYKYHDLEQVLQSVKASGESPFFVILDEIEDPHNLGAIIRSAEGAGVHGVIIGKRRSASVNSTVEKTSAGATSFMPVIRVTNLVSAVERLKKENIWVYALDMSGESYSKAGLTGGIALVVGNEGKGISRLMREKSDHLVSIPMRGQIQSLNASVAASILMYEALSQREKQEK